VCRNDQGILSHLNADGIDIYVRRLRDIFFEGVEHHGSGDKQGSGGQCEWALDQVRVVHLC
jgi:hypothetical protein